MEPMISTCVARGIEMEACGVMGIALVGVGAEDHRDVIE